MVWQASHIEHSILLAPVVQTLDSAIQRLNNPGQMFRSKPHRQNFGIEASVRPLVVEGWQETLATIWHIICRSFNWETEIRHNVCPSNSNASTSFKGPGFRTKWLKVVLRCTPDPRKCFRSHNPLNSYAAVYRSRSTSSWSFLRIVHTSKRLLRWNVVYFALFCLFVCYCLLPPTYTTQKPWLFFQW